MTFAYTLNVLLIVLGLLLGLGAYWLATWLLKPSKVEAAASACEKGLITNFLIGLIPFAILVFVDFRLIQIPRIGILASGVLLVVIFAICQNGVAGLALLLGRRAFAGTIPNRPWEVMTRGSMILTLSFLIPIIGWLVFFPGSFVLGMGVSIRSLFAGKKAVIPPTLPAAPPALPS